MKIKQYWKLLLLLLLVLPAPLVSVQANSDSAIIPGEATVQNYINLTEEGKNYTPLGYMDSVERFDEGHSQWDLSVYGNTDPVGSLSAPAQKVYDTLLSGNTVVDLRGLGVANDKNSILALMNEIYDYDSLLYYCMRILGYGWNYTSATNTVTDFYIIINGDATRIKTQRLELKNATDLVLKEIDPNWDDKEKALAIHDYLGQSITYEFTPNDQTPYGALVEKRCVCNGYATAYEMLMEFLDIPTIRVVSEPMNHAWNLIKLDGAWYHVDATWDDVNSNNIADPYVGYKYFLRTDAEMQSNELAHYSWDSQGISAISKAFENMPRTRCEAYMFSEDAWFYGGNGEIMTAAYDGTSPRVAKADCDPNGLLALGKQLYLTKDQSIYRWTPENDRMVQVYTLKDEEQGDYAYISRLFKLQKGSLGYTYWTYWTNVGHEREGVCSIIEVLSKGDINGDFAIDVMDMLLIQDHILGKQAMTQEEKTAADINGDSYIDVMDMLAIQDDILGKVKIDGD